MDSKEEDHENRLKMC